MVKPLLTLQIALLFFVSSALGQTRSMPELQTDPIMSKWRVTTLDFQLGATTDHYGSMSLQELSAFAIQPDQIQRDLSGMEEVVSTSTSGLSFFAQMGFSPADFSNGEYKKNQMFRVGIGIHSPKEAMIKYRDAGRDTSIVYCNLHSEVSLELSYIFMGDLGKKKRWKWHAGVGGNAGTTFNNQMMVISGRYLEDEEHPTEMEEDEMITDTYEARAVRYLRGFIIGGIGYELGCSSEIENKWVLGMEMRLGLGNQFVQGGNSNPIQKTSSFGFFMRKRFR